MTAAPSLPATPPVGMVLVAGPGVVEATSTTISHLPGVPTPVAMGITPFAKTMLLLPTVAVTVPLQVLLIKPLGAISIPAAAIASLNATLLTALPVLSLISVMVKRVGSPGFTMPGKPAVILFDTAIAALAVEIELRPKSTYMKSGIFFIILVNK